MNVQSKKVLNSTIEEVMGIKIRAKKISGVTAKVYDFAEDTPTRVEETVGS